MGENNHMQLFIMYFLSVFGMWLQAYEGHYVNPWLNAKSLISWLFFFSQGLSHATVCVLQAICRSQGDNLSVPRSFQICRLLIKAEDDIDISLSNSCRNIHSQIYHYKNHVGFLVSPGGQCTIHIHAVQTKWVVRSMCSRMSVSHCTIQVPCLSNALFVLSAVSAQMPASGPLVWTDNQQWTYTISKFSLSQLC